MKCGVKEIPITNLAVITKSVKSSGKVTLCYTISINNSENPYTKIKHIKTN